MSTISVIMATKNGSMYLKESIKSVLSQTIKDIQFIIVDDGSTDGTLDLLQQFAKKDNRVEVIENSNSEGLAYSLNRALEHVNSDFVARMDDDDISASNRFEVELQFLKNNLNYAFVGTGAKLFDESGIYGEWIPKAAFSLKDLFLGRVYIHPTVVFRTSILRSVGGYSTDGRMNRIEDWNLWLNLYNNGYFGYTLQHAPFEYRESINSFKKRNFTRRKNQFRMLSYWRKKMNLRGMFCIYPLIPLIKGLVPGRLIQLYHHMKY